MDQINEQMNEDVYVNQSLAILAIENRNAQETLPHFDFEKYDLCEFYYFRRPHLKIGFQPAQGGIIQEAATIYPEAWQYLQTLEGQKMCTTESEWQAMTQAEWHTNENGTKVGWNGIGGAPFYAPDYATGALRLPDLRGMYAEGVGFDSLDVGGVHGDAVRDIQGQFTLGWYMGHPTVELYTGPFSPKGLETSHTGFEYSSPGYSTVHFNVSRTVPTAAKNQPRAWGALACVYLGAPR